MVPTDVISGFNMAPFTAHFREKELGPHTLRVGKNESASKAFLRAAYIYP
jgi:hypothetical protein